MILLFDEDETKFDSLGLGVLKDAISCTVAEALNDGFTLELEYPVNGINFDKIRINRIIFCKPNPYDDAQPFRIASISRPIKGVVTVDANHISYDMNGIPVSPFKGGSFLDVINNIKKNCIVPNSFEFINSYPIGKKFYKTFELTSPVNLKALLTSESDSIADIYEVEFKYDRWNVIFYGTRGSDKGMEVRYSKNMTDITQETTNESLYSAVYPYYHKETTTTTSTSTDAGFPKVYIVGNKPFQDGWLSYSEGGEPYHPVDESAVQIASDGQFKDKIYAWDSKTYRYEEKIYNQSVTLMEGMGKDPDWIKIDWSKFPVVSCAAVVDGYFKTITSTEGWKYHKAGDIIFDGKVTDLSNISSNMIIYYSEVIPPTEASTQTESTKVVHVELDGKIRKLTSDDAKGMKYTNVLPLDLTSSFDQEPTKEKLKEKAEEYIKKNKLGKLKKSTTVSFVDLRNITEASDLKLLKSVEIGDTVSVVYPDLGVNEKLRVISTKYNAIIDSYDSIELGEKKSKLSDDSISKGDTVSSLTNDSGYTDEDKVSKIVAQTVSADYIQAINAKLSKAQINQLETERIKCTGILEASQFELDKLVAKMLVADNANISQTLNAGQIKVSGDISIKSGQINIRGNDGTVFNVSREGQVTANGMKITGGSIEIQNGENNTSFSVDKDGYLRATGATINGNISASAGTIGGCEIVDGVLKIPTANITGEFNVGDNGLTSVVDGVLKTTTVLANNLQVKWANIVDKQLIIGDLTDKVDAAVKNANDAAANANNSASKADTAATNATSVTEKLQKADSDYTAAKEANEKASNYLTEATTNLTDAQTKYDTAKSEYETAKSNNETSKEDLEKAKEQLTDAETNLANAKDELTSAKESATTASNNLAEAEKKYTDASNAYTEATTKFTDAEGKYNTALKDADAANNALTDAKNKYDTAAKEYTEAKTNNETSASTLKEAENNYQTAKSDYETAQKASAEASTKLTEAEKQYDQAVKDYKDALENLNTKLTEGQQGAANLVEQRLKNAALSGQTESNELKGFILDKDGLRSYTGRTSTPLTDDSGKEIKDSDGNTIYKPDDNYNSLTTTEQTGVYLSEKGLRMGGRPSINQDDYFYGNYFSNTATVKRNEVTQVIYPTEEKTTKGDNEQLTTSTVERSLKAGDTIFVYFDISRTDTDATAFSFTLRDQKDHTILISIPVKLTENERKRSDIGLLKNSDGSQGYTLPNTFSGKLEVLYNYDGKEDIVRNIRIYKKWAAGLIITADGTIIGSELHIGGAEIVNGVLTVPATSIKGTVSADIVECEEGHIAGFRIKSNKLVNGKFVTPPTDEENAANKKEMDDAAKAEDKARQARQDCYDAFTDAEARLNYEKNNGGASDKTQKMYDTASADYTAASNAYTEAHKKYKDALYKYNNADHEITDVSDIDVNSIAEKGDTNNEKPAIYIGTDGIHITKRTKKTEADYVTGEDTTIIDQSNFKVTTDGRVQADNVVISGTIKSTDGNIGGMTIKNNSIYYPENFDNFNKDTEFDTVTTSEWKWVYDPDQKLVYTPGGVPTWISEVHRVLSLTDYKVVNDSGVYIGQDGIRIGMNAKKHIEDYVSKNKIAPYLFGGIGIGKEIVDEKQPQVITNTYEWDKPHGGFMIDRNGNTYMANANIDGTIYGNIYSNGRNDPFRYVTCTTGNLEGLFRYVHIGTLAAINHYDNGGAVHITGYAGNWVGEKQKIDIVVSSRGGLKVTGSVIGGINPGYLIFDIVTTNGYDPNIHIEDIFGNSNDGSSPNITSSNPAYDLYVKVASFQEVVLNVNSVGCMPGGKYRDRFCEVLKYDPYHTIYKGTSKYFNYEEGGITHRINVYSILEEHLNLPYPSTTDNACSWPEQSQSPTPQYSLIHYSEDGLLSVNRLRTTFYDQSVTFNYGKNGEYIFAIQGANGATYNLADMKSVTSDLKSNYTLLQAFVNAGWANLRSSNAKFYFYSKSNFSEDSWWNAATISESGTKYAFVSSSYDADGQVDSNMTGGLGGHNHDQQISVNINSDGKIWVSNDGYTTSVWLMVVVLS